LVFLLWNCLRPASFAVVLGVSIAASAGPVCAQDPRPAQSPLYGGNAAAQPADQQSGSATGGVFAPVLDAEKRPITAGVGHYSAQGTLLTPLTKKQVKAAEKTRGGKVRKTTFPPRLQIPQQTRDSHFTTASTTTD
jgi:hypothetical protein